MIRMTGKVRAVDVTLRGDRLNTRREDIRMLGSQHLRGPISYVVGRSACGDKSTGTFPPVATRAPWNVIIYGCSLAWQQFRNVSGADTFGTLCGLFGSASSRPHRRGNHDRPVHRVIDNERGNL